MKKMTLRKCLSVAEQLWCLGLAHTHLSDLPIFGVCSWRDSYRSCLRFTDVLVSSPAVGGVCMPLLIHQYVLDSSLWAVPGR